MRETAGTGKTILLVDDVADNRFILRLLLEGNGYRVVEAKSGREAVEIAGRECPDLILMDLNLPEMDGLEATRLIRGLESLCNTPVVAVSAFDASDFRDRALAAGCDAYVTKPIDFDLLENVVGQFCHDS